MKIDGEALNIALAQAVMNAFTPEIGRDAPIVILSWAGGVGPAATEVVVAPPVAVVVDALSYIVSALFVFTIKGSEPAIPPIAGPRGSRVERLRGFGGEIREGLAFVLGHPIYAARRPRRARATCSGTSSSGSISSTWSGCSGSIHFGSV